MHTNIEKLRWSCRRGMLELDILLLRFLENCYSNLPQSEQLIFEKLLTCSDPDLYRWLTGKAISTNADYQHLINKIRYQNDPKLHDPKLTT